MHKLRVASLLTLWVSVSSSLSALSAAPQSAHPPPSIPLNSVGLPTVDSAGRRLAYSRSELSSSVPKAASVSLGMPAVAGAPGVPSSWQFAAFGSGIGDSNIVLTRTRRGREVLVGGAMHNPEYGSYWYALRHAPATGEYEQVFVSDLMPSAIISLDSSDIRGDDGFEIIVALRSGEIRLYDQDSKQPLAAFSTVPDLTAMTLRDFDGDGKSEIVLTTSGALLVYSGAGLPVWDLPGVGGSGVAVGQMDDDASLEIVTTSGDVVDVATQNVQWHWPAGFGVAVRAGDVDDDGRDEVVAAEGWIFVWAYDVERQLPKWSIAASQYDIGAIALADVDCDGKPELIVGDGQWGNVKAIDPVTQIEEWTIVNPEHGVTNVAVGDADGDGTDEVLWGAGATSSGADHLYVADLATETLEWASIDLSGPFIGPEAGDIDGDGRLELVAVSSLSDAGYGGGRIIVIDAETLQLRAVSDAIGSGFFPMQDLKLRNVDADASLEIVLAADHFYDGLLRIFDFDGVANTFSLKWSSTPPAGGSPFYSVEVADVDADGAQEVVAGGSGLFAFVYVYDYASGALEWYSFQLASGGGIVRSVAVETGGGGHPDILAIVDGGGFYGFDGVTKDPLQITPGTFTAMRLDPDPGMRSVWLGDQGGNVYRYDRGVTTYEPAGTYPLGLPAIDGLTPLPDGGMLVGAGGRISMYPSLSGPPAWTSADFGPPFGRHASLGAGINARFFSGSAAAIVEIASGSDLASVSPTSGPASGGATITVVGTGFQPGSALFVGEQAATALVPEGPTSIQGDVPALPPGTLHTVTVLNPDTSFSSLDGAFFADFLDVNAAHPFHDFIEQNARHGVTAGCGAGLFCPSQPVSRGQMAVFLVRAGLGPDFLPPKAAGDLFVDVTCGSFAANEIELLVRLGVTAGCGGGAYCGSSPVTRAQMAVFLLKMLEGAGYAPPPAQGIFADVPAADPFAPSIEELSSRGITAGCGGGNYCPGDSTTRGQMAVFLSRTFFAP